MISLKASREAALARQAERIQRRFNRLELLSASYWPIKLGIIFGGVFLTITIFSIIHVIGILCFFLTIAAFYIAHRRHGKIDKSVVRHRVWLQMISTQLARLQLDWENIPATPPRDEHTEHAEHTDHPFDTDLDITGPRSLHQLINMCVSYEGMDRLRNWLLATTPDKLAVRFRQAIVQELAPLTGFRGKLQLSSLYVTRYSAEQWDSERLLAWLQDWQEVPGTAVTLLVHSAICAVTLLLFLSYLFFHVPPYFCIASLAASFLWFSSRKGEQKNIFVSANYVKTSFGQLRVIFEYLEKYPYSRQGYLRELCEPFHTAAMAPSFLLKHMSRLSTMASMASSGEGSLFLNALLPWNAYINFQLNKYIAQAQESVPLWLDTWFELEALCSLANFAYLNPDYTMPEISFEDTQSTQTTHSTYFRAQGLSHPLLKDKVKVPNDIAFEHVHEILLITGSNMAGKSTFLRSMGINLCLAYTGTVVNATLLQTSLFEIYTAIKVNDSVTDGYSYFFAEVRRLKALLNRVEQQPDYPIFFLVDEIFKGTNNRERLIGSEAYIYALADKNCIGAVTTHDLELVHIAEELPLIRNYHFREEIIDGNMVFDYKLRRGPSPTTNALKIMELEGLPTSIKKVAH